MTIKQHNLRQLGHKIQNCLISNAVNPLHPNIHIKFSKLIFIHFLKNVLREFDKRSKINFLLGDQFINSYNLISGQSMDMVRRKLMLVTIGT